MRIPSGCHISLAKRQAFPERIGMQFAGVHFDLARGLAWARGFGNVLREKGFFDRWLLAALAAGLVLGLQGFGWGRYDCLNLDRMALRSVVSKGRPYLHPKSFVKPPFYTYMNHFLADVPAKNVSKSLFWLDADRRKQAYLLLRLGLARSLSLALFAGSILLVFSMVRHAFGVPAARMSALLLATTAGFIPYQVFLTTDLALVFMMLASFACAVKIVERPGMGLSIAAGLLAGLATATKYNGLIVAAALPAAHLLASRRASLLACLKRPSAWVCGLAVPVGFLLGNPYALLDWPMFSADFIYNYKVTPVYNGVTDGHGYAAFFRAFGEIFGWPGTWFVALGTFAGIVALVGRAPLPAAKPGADEPQEFCGKPAAWPLWLLAALVFVAYAWKIGDFPRVETRFVLPAAPFALILGAAGFPVLLRAGWLAIPAFALVLAYNLACGWWVGEMFRNDPRMEALAFAEKSVPRNATIEISDSIPKVQELPDRSFHLVKIPNAIERGATFAKIFAQDKEMQEVIKRREDKVGIEWFSKAARQARNPDWIFWSNIDVEGIVWPQYNALFQAGSGYEVAWDRSSPSSPWWSYPQNTEFLRNRTTVWKRPAPQP